MQIPWTTSGKGTLSFFSVSRNRVLLIQPSLRMKVVVHLDNSRYVTGAYKALLGLCSEMEGYRHVWVVPRGSKIAPEVRDRYVSR